MIRTFFRKALWLTVPPALGVLFAIAGNSNFQHDGMSLTWNIGNPSFNTHQADVAIAALDVACRRDRRCR
jgi:hypothetical protein